MVSGILSLTVRITGMSSCVDSIEPPICVPLFPWQTNSLLLVSPTEGVLYQVSPDSLASSVKELLPWKQRDRGVREYKEMCLLCFSTHSVLSPQMVWVSCFCDDYVCSPLLQSRTQSHFSELVRWQINIFSYWSWLCMGFVFALKVIQLQVNCTKTVYS